MSQLQATREASSPRSTVRAVREVDRERWADFVRDHPYGSVYHTPEMHDVFARTRNYRPAVWVAVDAAGGIRGLITPCEITAIGGPLRSLTTRDVLYGAPLVASGSDRRAVIQTLLAAYQQQGSRRPLFSEIRHLADPGDLAPQLAAAGFRHEPHLNFLMDLGSPEVQLWKRVAASARRNVRKAERMGVTVEPASDPAGVAEGYEVLRDVYRRIQVPLADRSLFEACFDILRPLGWFQMLLARRCGRTVGVLSLLRCQRTAHYWYAGALRTQPPSGAGDLLAWHAIRSSRAAGCRVLDFGGAGRPDKPYGVRDFKAKYGGQLVDFGRDVWPSAPVRLRLATAGYGLARRFL